MAEPADAEPRYRAFLSYSHKDADEAARIHRRLEGYRLPRRLVGRETDRGPVPRRLWPIFRDREEMAASADLSETVRAALEQSAALIVLCSPASAASLWVAEEIATFRTLHPDRPVLAAIIAGEPPDCFPAPLRARDSDGAWHEPLATDLRRERDGPHLGLLKLVAGLTGLGLDDLVQRDASRRIRRVTAVTGIALAAMLIMAMLTVFALGARQEADRQRAEAEGLIEFMLTDLRERLRGVGRLDVLTAVNERALSYYGQQDDLTSLSPDALERRARILHAMGDDDLRRGDLSRALVAFSGAYRTTSEQLIRAPDDADRVFAHAQSEYWVGRVDELRGNYHAAMAAYERYRRLGNRLRQLAPTEPRTLGELGYSENNLGIVYHRGFRRPAGARPHFLRALAYFLEALRKEPDNRAWLAAAAEAHAWIADSWFADRQYQESRLHRLEEQRLKRRLLTLDPNNSEYRYALVITSRSLARVALELRESEAAAAMLAQARADLLPLLRLDERNVVWREQAVRIELDRARLLTEMRRFELAASALAAAGRILAESSGQGPNAADETGELARTIRRMTLDLMQARKETRRVAT